MEKRKMKNDICRAAIFVTVLTLIGGLAFAAGLAWSLQTAEAAEKSSERAEKEAPAAATKKERIVYPKKTDLDFEGADIQGELRSPGEFYFQRKTEEKFESLVKRRPNFHREMLRDVVVGK